MQGAKQMQQHLQMQQFTWRIVVVDCQHVIALLTFQKYRDDTLIYHCEVKAGLVFIFLDERAGF